MSESGDSPRLGLLEGSMRLVRGLLLLLAVASPSLAAGQTDEQKELEAWARGLDKASVHKAVLAHEGIRSAPIP